MSESANTGMALIFIWIAGGMLALGAALGIGFLYLIPYLYNHIHWG